MKGSVMVSNAGCVALSTVLLMCSMPDQLLCVFCACAQDAMSEAVEGADLMLYGVSEKYKER